MFWIIERSEQVRKQLNKTEKRFRQEVKNVLKNTDKYYTALNNGLLPNNIKTPCVHNDLDGFYSIDQRGKGTNLREFRLYVYPDIETKLLHLIRFAEKGEPSKQNEDIKLSKKYINNLKGDRHEKTI